VLAYADGPAADLAFRRGWTHGIPALIVLPFLLAGAMVLLDRWPGAGFGTVTIALSSPPSAGPITPR
jgi:hypothetical protein